MDTRSPLIMFDAPDGSLVIRTNNQLVEKNPIDVSLINSLRRTLDEVESIRFFWKNADQVKVKSNSRWFIKSIAHRMGYIPINEPRPDLLQEIGLTYYIAQDPDNLDEPFIHDGRESIVLNSKHLICMFKPSKDDEPIRIAPISPADQPEHGITRDNYGIMTFPNCYHAAPQTVHIEAKPAFGNAVKDPAFKVCTSSFRHLPRYEMNCTSSENGTKWVDPDQARIALDTENRALKPKYRFIQPKQDVPRTLLFDPLVSDPTKDGVPKHLYSTPQRTELVITHHNHVMDPVLALWHAARILRNKINIFQDEALENRNSKKVYVTDRSGLPIEYLIIDEDATLTEVIRKQFMISCLQRAFQEVEGQPVYNNAQIKRIVRNVMAAAYKQSPTANEITLKLQARFVKNDHEGFDASSDPKFVDQTNVMLIHAIEQLNHNLTRIIEQIQDYAEQKDIELYLDCDDYVKLRTERLLERETDKEVPAPDLYQTQPVCMNALAKAAVTEAPVAKHAASSKPSIKSSKQTSKQTSKKPSKKPDKKPPAKSGVWASAGAGAGAGAGAKV